MRSDSARCPACGSSTFEQLIDFGIVPRSGTFLSTPDQPYSNIALSFDFCAMCALLRQRLGKGSAGDYAEVSRSTAGQVPMYAKHLAESFLRGGTKPDDLVIEVGANDGTFLDVLRDADFGNTLGVEPSGSCAETCRAKGHRIVERHLDRPAADLIRATHGAAAAIVCRHTLEHVPDPFAFVEALAALLRNDGLLFLEVPNARAVTHQLRGHELWDEHLHIFTPDNLVALVTRTSFDVTAVAVWPHHGTTNILLWARLRTPIAGHSPRTEMADDLAFCRAFAARWESLTCAVRAEVSQSGKPALALGAAHPQSNYVHFAALADEVAFFVDDDPEKTGRFLPATHPLRILSSSEFLGGAAPGTVLRTAFGHEPWMDRLLAPLVSMRVQVIDPYEAQFFCRR